jgi:Mg2+ and Co2+ transporter CorA
MDDIKPVLPDTTQVDFAEELTQARQDLQNAEGKIMQLELALLQSRDFAIGAAAEAGEAPAYRAMYVESQKQLGDANAHIASHVAHIQRLESALSDALRMESANKNLHRQINELKTSATWRIGKVLLTPLRVIKRIIR